MEKQTTTGNQASQVVLGQPGRIGAEKSVGIHPVSCRGRNRELLGRRKSERRKPVDNPPGYRNGYGKERKLTLGCGTITLRRPRVRGLEKRFESPVVRASSYRRFGS